MASPKVLLGRLVGPLLFKKATVTRVERASPRFALIALEGADLRGASWRPGDKVQLFLPEGLRTYTPLSWEARGATTLLAFAHGAGSPGARWAASVQRGDTVQVFGPRRSLDAGDGATRVAVLGDETSLGLAVALAARHDVTAFLEVDDADEAKAALAATGTRAELRCFPRTASEAHLPALAEAVRTFGAPLALFSGRAKSIQSLRALLRGGGASKTKAYWADGKRGLD